MSFSIVVLTYTASTMLLLFHQIVNDKAICHTIKIILLLQFVAVTNKRDNMPIVSLAAFRPFIYSANYYYEGKETLFINAF